MVAVEEEKCIEIILPDPNPPALLKPIDLKSVGFLHKHPTLICCPACLAETTSVVRLEVVTCWQKFLQVTNMCKTSENRCDINHYCSICGCFIGRYMAVSCSERCLSKQARKKAANDAMMLKTKPKDCAQHMQKARDRVKEKRTKQKIKKLDNAKENEDKSLNKN